MNDEGRRVGIGMNRDVDWDAIRAEYVAGGIGQSRLADKWGVSPGALKHRARCEGWTAQRDERAAGAACDAAEDDAGIATRVRRKLLLRLERVTDAIPDELVTEVKTQEASTVKMFRLKDLTAAYKDVAGDMVEAADAREESNIILDV